MNALKQVQLQVYARGKDGGQYWQRYLMEGDPLSKLDALAAEIANGIAPNADFYEQICVAEWDGDRAVRSRYTVNGKLST